MTATLVATFTASVLLAACGSDAPKEPSTSAGSSGGGWTLTRINAALLTGADVGSAYVARVDAAPATPLPCAAAGSRPLVIELPPTNYLARVLQSDHAAVKEAVYSYRDAALAAKAVALVKKGLDCHTGTLYSAATGSSSGKQAVAITTVAKPPLTVDDAAAWTFRTSDAAGELVVARIGGLMMTLTFEAPAGTPSSAVPNAATVSRTAVGKLR